VNDNGELEVPYIGLVPAQGRTCRELAYAIKAALEKEYYYHATVILAIERVSEKSRGRIYVYGSVKGQGPQEIPADESYTVSKAIIRAGGFGDFANKRKVKVTRKNGQDFTIDLKRVIEEGRTDEDMVLQPDDQIYVPQRLINM
jgi:polysaccharide export outer membrane protein